MSSSDCGISRPVEKRSEPSAGTCSLPARGFARRSRCTAGAYCPFASLESVRGRLVLFTAPYTLPASLEAVIQGAVTETAAPFLFDRAWGPRASTFRGRRSCMMPSSLKCVIQTINVSVIMTHRNRRFLKDPVGRTY